MLTELFTTTQQSLIYHDADAYRYNNTAYPSELYGPTGPEASQAQAFTFLVPTPNIDCSMVANSIKLYRIIRWWLTSYCNGRSIVMVG